MIERLVSSHAGFWGRCESVLVGLCGVIRRLSGTIALSMIAGSVAAQAQIENLQGKRYYDQVCAKCHDVGIGPAIKGRGFPAATFVLFARNGNRAMPAFRLSDVDDATLQAVADYLAGTPVAVPLTQK